MSYQESTGTARTFSVNGFSTSNDQSRLMQPPPPTAHLSEGVRCFLLRQEQEGLATLSLAEYRGAAWSLFEFLQRDPPWGELGPDTAPRWMDWLRTTPIYRRKCGAYPRYFSPAAVAEFLATPQPKLVSPNLPEDRARGAKTVAKYRRQGCRILSWLGMRVEIERRKRKQHRRLPPIVPRFDTIAERWQAILASSASEEKRRRIVLTQALILLWGTRLTEGLTACLDDVEGHWALVEGKTGMRLSYLNSQALGIVAALRGQSTLAWAEPKHRRISGWPYSSNKWHADLRKVGIDDGEKPQQDLRKRFASWVQRRDPEVEQLLAGHGGGVIFDHYLAIVERVPRVMERFKLPALEGFDLAGTSLPVPPGRAKVHGAPSRKHGQPGP